MQKSISLLRKGFESSSGTTQEFINFVKTFKKEFEKEFEKELKDIGATDIKINKGHFYLYGFFTVNQQIYYFSLSDVRGAEYSNEYSLMYRTAKDHKDWTGGSNQWVTIETGMWKNKVFKNILT